MRRPIQAKHWQNPTDDFLNTVAVISNSFAARNAALWRKCVTWPGIATIAQPEPPPLILLPFALLLISIAFAPIVLRHH
jgi:hypothetical protein